MFSIPLAQISALQSQQAQCGSTAFFLSRSAISSRCGDYSISIKSLTAAKNKK
jgi:hypothetical protein